MDNGQDQDGWPKETWSWFTSFFSPRPKTPKPSEAPAQPAPNVVSIEEYAKLKAEVEELKKIVKTTESPRPIRNEFQPSLPVTPLKPSALPFSFSGQSTSPAKQQFSDPPLFRTTPVKTYESPIQDNQISDPFHLAPLSMEFARTTPAATPFRTPTKMTPIKMTPTPFTPGFQRNITPRSSLGNGSHLTPGHKRIREDLENEGPPMKKRQFEELPKSLPKASIYAGFNSETATTNTYGAFASTARKIMDAMSEMREDSRISLSTPKKTGSSPPTVSVTPRSTSSELFESRNIFPTHIPIDIDGEEEEGCRDIDDEDGHQ